MSKLRPSSTKGNIIKRISTNFLVEGLVQNQSDWLNFIDSHVQHTTFGLGRISSIELRPEFVSDGPLITVIFDGHGKKLFNQRSFLSDNFSFIQCNSVYVSLLESNIKRNNQVELERAKRNAIIKSKYLEKHAKVSQQREFSNLDYRDKSIKSNNPEVTSFEKDQFSYDRPRQPQEHGNEKQCIESNSFSSNDHQDYLSSNKYNILEMYDQYCGYAGEVLSHDDSFYSCGSSKSQNYINKEIKAALINFEIRNVIHFTRVENLESILENGLLSRSILDNSGLKYMSQDKYRLDGRIDAICLSISFPNWQLLHKQRKRSDHEDNWVVLELNPEILSSHDVAFTQKNAATSNQDTGLKGYSDFLLLFEEVPNKPSREQMGLPKNYPTNPQSEVLCFDSVKPRYIKTVHFPKNFVDEKYKYYKLSERFKHVKFKKNDYYFRPRSDREYWKQSPKDIEVF